MSLLPMYSVPISIHAPPRGATDSNRRLVHFVLISIHAPPRGATKKLAENPKKVLFQFTPLREGRRALCQNRYVLPDFNSRPSARGDEQPPRAATTTRRFQFTPLREGRQHGGADRSTQHHFNSRPSARGDQPEIAALTQYLFQFTPLREGRQISRNAS